jgi:hypothetical protein
MERYFSWRVEPIYTCLKKAQYRKYSYFDRSVQYNVDLLKETKSNWKRWVWNPKQSL